MFSLGSSKSKSSSQATASSSSQSSTDQSVFLADIFAQLYGGATSAAGGISTDGLTQTANRLFTQGDALLSELAGGSGVQTGGVNRVGDITLPGSTADDEIAQLQADLGRFFDEEINPGITAQAVAGGTLGGGRQGVAQGTAATGLAQEFARGATDIRGRDIDRQIAVQQANQQAGLRNEELSIANRTANNQALLGDRAGRTDAAGVGLGSLGSLYGISEAGTTAALNPFLALADILGGPTTLTEQRASGSSQSQQTSTSKSKSFSLGFGLSD